MARMKKMSIVTTGTQKNGAMVTKEMLDSAVVNFNKDARPPVVTGHISDCSDSYPAYGRVGDPQVVESQDQPGEWELIIEVHYSAILEEMEDSGDFEGFSISLHPLEGREGWYIHHLAVLGSLPPAGDTKVLEVVELSALPQGKKAVQLSATVLEESILDMKKEDLEALVKNMTTDAVKDAVKEALKPDSEGNPATGVPAAPNAPAANVESEETKALKSQLAQVQETTKATRIDEIKALAETKDMSAEELKPIVDTLEATDAINLCDNSATGIFSSMKAIVQAKPAKASLPQQGLFQSLTHGAPVSLSAGQQPQSVDMMNIASESGF
ncbi:hypothetical protein RJD38_21175 [Vibrio scophthalmi]|uniref:hypothetical protein n=1 Tax=Vibrio scophthalmi TaxID=45658 RepID=UPI00349FB147